MCRTVLLTNICPRCMNPYTTRRGEYGTLEYETATIQEPELIVCSYAFETRQVCESAMTDTYDDGTEHPVPKFDILAQDFCHACVSRLKFHINNLPAPLQKRARWSTAVSDSALLNPNLEAEVTAALPRMGSTPTKLDLVKGGIDYLGYPLRDRNGHKPNIWIDVLDGNHIMAVPNRKGRGRKNKNAAKGTKSAAGVGKKRNKRKAAKKAAPKIKIAVLSTMKPALKGSLKHTNNNTTVSEPATPKQAGRHVHFDEGVEQPAEDSVKSVDEKANDKEGEKEEKGEEREQKKGTRASIPRKAKEKNNGSDSGSSPAANKDTTEE